MGQSTSVIEGNHMKSFTTVAVWGLDSNPENPDPRSTPTLIEVGIEADDKIAADDLCEILWTRFQRIDRPTVWTQLLDGHKLPSMSKGDGVILKSFGPREEDRYFIAVSRGFEEIGESMFLAWMAHTQPQDRSFDLAYGFHAMWERAMAESVPSIVRWALEPDEDAA